VVKAIEPTVREICVCIATHRRPQQLERLLGALVEQSAPPFEVVVVDNDAGRSAEPIAVAFRERLSLTYLVEPVRGLARVRNRAVAASRSKFLAIIDDDHCPCPGWLASHYQIAAQTNAAVVVGRSDVLFDDEVPDFIRTCGLFSKKHYADGETVPWYDAFTANCFIRRDALPHATAPFSTSFDLTGGEDVDLFRRMIDGGALVVAAAQARTVSYRPASRANLYWVLRRALRNGGTSVEVDQGLGDWRQGVRRGWNASVEGMRQAARARRYWRRDKSRAVRHLVQACGEFGKVLRQLGIRIEEYRHHS
jgi:succinoglycan biosynthesis protein ExoM